MILSVAPDIDYGSFVNENTSIRIGLYPYPYIQTDLFKYKMSWDVHTQ